MDLNRIDLADIHAPRRLGKALHDSLGSIAGAVPIIDIARALDITEIGLDTFDGFEGMLLTNKVRHRGAILANTRYGQRRARFTVAHELGHFLLERHVLSDATGFKCNGDDMRERRTTQQHFRQEAEANQFAIEALAPVPLVQTFLKGDPDIRAALEMRDHLDISLEAALRRILDLTPDPLAVIWSQNGQVRYWSKTRAFPFVTCRKKQQLPKATPAFHAIANGTLRITQMAETNALAWISRPDIPVYEQTRVGQNGHAITLLWAHVSDEDDDDGGLPELGTPRFR